jgi:hypothetical protein
VKIQINLEDTSNGHVKIVVNPALADIMKDSMAKKTTLSPAETYAFIMADAVKKASDNLKNYEPSKIIKPGDFL